jgi:archaellum component FlaC
MLIDFETNKIEEILEKKRELKTLYDNINYELNTLNNLLFKLIPYNRLICVSNNIAIRIDTKKHSTVIDDIEARKTYYLNDLELSDYGTLLNIITSIIDWNKIIKNINSILDEELTFKYDNYNFLCDITNQLKEIISDGDEGDK